MHYAGHGARKGQGYYLPCPVHAVIGQLRLLADTFGQAKVDKGLLPMFPSASGGFVDKRHVVTCIEAVASLIGEPLEDHRGVRRYGGHSLRVTGDTEDTVSGSRVLALWPHSGSRSILSS